MGYLQDSVNNVAFIKQNNLSEQEFYLLNCDYLSVIEKISSDCYDLLSDGNYIVPKTKLAILPIINKLTEGTKADEVMQRINTPTENSRQKDIIYFLSKRVFGYVNLGDAETLLPDTNQIVTFREYITQIKAPPEYIIHEGLKTPLLGLMEVLAVARIINDIDVAGSFFNNVGYIVEEINYRKIARVVKIDPRFGFYNNTISKFLANLNYFQAKFNGDNEFKIENLENLVAQADEKSQSIDIYKEDNLNDYKRLQELKDIQYSTFYKGIIKWKNLSSKQKEQFMVALYKNIAILKNNNLINFLLDRDIRFAPLNARLKHYDQFTEGFRIFLSSQLRNIAAIYNFSDKRLALLNRTYIISH